MAFTVPRELGDKRPDFPPKKAAGQHLCLWTAHTLGWGFLCCCHDQRLSHCVRSPALARPLPAGLKWSRFLLLLSGEREPCFLGFLSRMISCWSPLPSVAKQIYMKVHREYFIFVFRAFQRFLVILFKTVFGALTTHKNNCLTNTAKWKLE